VNVESVTVVETLQGVQEEQKVREYTAPDAQKNAESSSEATMQSSIALGMQAVMKQPEVRTARIEELRARIEARAYQRDSMAIAHKLLEIEMEAED